MIDLQTGRFRLRSGRAPGDLDRAMALRARIFPVDRDGPDAADDRATHATIEDSVSGAPVAAFRALSLRGPELADASYAGQFYDLSKLSAFPAPLIELGRFCVAPGGGDPDILRLAWAGITRLVDRDEAGLLFGCTSFAGCDPAPHAAALSLLGGRYRGPDRWRPTPGRGPVVRFDDLAPAADPRAALQAMPTLMRSYLGMGGWVSDHAVIDAGMGTLHVFTGVETARIPPARARRLRALAATG